jgi:16S rRNA (cytosine1402-N4)-methyltransferase
MSSHLPVMVEEFLKFFSEVELSVFFDGTVGMGGHAEALLKEHPEITTYIGCDRDPEALQAAKEKLAPWKDRVELVKANFADLDTVLEERKIRKVNGFFLI